MMKMMGDANKSYKNMAEENYELNQLLSQPTLILFSYAIHKVPNYQPIVSSCILPY